MYIMIWVLCFFEALRNGAGAISAHPIVINARNVELQYELYMVRTSFLGAMSTCQSRAGGQGVLSPLATMDDIDAIAEIIIKGCLTYTDWNDEYFLVGLTSVGHLESLGFLDRPHPGSSTVLLSALALHGVGFQNSYWPDAANTSSAAVLSSTPSIGMAASILSNISAVQPLCAAVRVLLLLPETPSLNSSATVLNASTGNDTTPIQLIPACSNEFRQLLSQEGQSTANSPYQLEVNIINCDGKVVARPNGTTNDSNVVHAEVGSLHAFTCRVPANTKSLPTPSPSGFPPAMLSPSTPPPSPAPPPPSPDPPSPTQQTTFPSPYQPPPPLVQNTLPSRRSLTDVGTKERVLLQMSPRTSGPPPNGPTSSQKAPKPPWPLPPSARSPTAPPTAPLGHLSATATPIDQRCDELSLDTPAAPTGPGDNSTGTGVSGDAWRYLACYVPVSWSEAAALCERLLPGGSLAVWESQAQMDPVAKLLAGKDLVGSYGFWYGLVSGVNVGQTANLSTVPLEYILTDPRVSPSYMSQLCIHGNLTVHATCLQNHPPPIVTLPSPKAISSPPTHPPPPSSIKHLPINSSLQPSGSETSPPNVSVTISQPPVSPPESAASTSVPHSDGCCGSVLITAPTISPGYVDYSPIRIDLQLRVCHQPMSFICQAPYDSPTSSVGAEAPLTQGAVSPGTSGAMNLLAGLFLDALSPTYSGEFKMFRAVTQLRLEGTTAAVLWGPSGGGGGSDEPREWLVNQTLQELTVATQLPYWSFILQGPTPGSTVLPLNITVRSLPRATLDNFAEFLAAFVVSRPAGDLLSAAYRGAWGVQAYSVQIITLEELFAPVMPPAPATSHAVPIQTLLLIACTIGGSMLAFGILTALLIRRHWQQHRRSTTIYTMRTDSGGELPGTAPKNATTDLYNTLALKPSLTFARSVTPINAGRGNSANQGWADSSYSGRGMGLGTESETAADPGAMAVTTAAAIGAGSIGLTRGSYPKASLMRTESGGSVGRVTQTPNNGLLGLAGVDRSRARPSLLDVTVVGVGSGSEGVTPYSTTTSPYSTVGASSLRPTSTRSVRGLLARAQSMQNASQEPRVAEGPGSVGQANAQERL